MFRWTVLLLCAALLDAQEVRLQVLETTDVRGHVLPQDSYTLQPVPGGWAKLGALIRTLRAANPNTLLVDCGDGTQGERINYVWSHLKPSLPEPIMAIMNALGYTAMVVGHHEFDNGFKTLRAVEEQAQFPWLAANIRFAGTDKHAFTPYLKVEAGGVQVAILGLVAGHARTRPDAHDAGLTYQDPVACARELIPRLREQEKVDLVVVALHSGLGNAPCEAGLETQAQCLADQVKGIDLILAGHTGQQVSVRRNGVPILQAGSSGQVLGVADLTLRKNRSRWDLVGCETRLVQPPAELEPDPAVLQATADLRTATTTYLNTFATNLGTDLDGRWFRMEDTPVGHLLHTVVRQATGAQITAVAAPPSKLFIPKGPTSVRQFYALAPREDGVARIRITGRQLRLYLEQAARCFAFSHLPDLFNRAAAPDDYDTLEGVSYALDISKPAGSRVVSLSHQGKPVKDDQVFTLGLSARRLGGIGGYLDAMGWKGEAEFLSAVSLRNLLLTYVLARPNLTVGVENAWRIIPALDRERLLAQLP